MSQTPKLLPIQALSPAQQANLKRELYAGHVFLLPPSPQSQALASLSWQRVCSSLQAWDVSHPARAHLELDNAHWQQALAATRQTLQSDPALKGLYAELLQGLGLTAGVADLPRLRGIVPGLEAQAAAAPVFFAHRDTWYANPQSQLNLWIPLQAYPWQQTFRFWPQYFAQAVPNDSDQFHAESWLAEVGFQQLKPKPTAAYPRALSLPPETEAVGFACPAGALLLFAAAQLHQTCVNPGPQTRYSLDLRWVDPADQALGLGAPNLDNAASGSTLSSYTYLQGAPPR